jgi:hypothetical protein
MKSKPFEKIIRLIISASFMAIVIGFSTLGGASAADQIEAADGVVLVHLKYEAGRWQMGKEGVRILPCDPPNYFKSGSEKDPRVRILGDGDKLLYEKNIRNPRLVLYEDPKMKAQLLEKVAFNLRLPFHRGMQVFEFYQGADSEYKKGGPAIRADMNEAIKRFDEMAKSGDWLPCRQPQLK